MIGMDTITKILNITLIAGSLDSVEPPVQMCWALMHMLHSSISFVINMGADREDLLEKPQDIVFY